MRRSLTPLALLAGLAVLLNGCAGESPTAPGGGSGGSGGSSGGPGGGTCTSSLTLAASDVQPLASTAVAIRATAKRNNQPVPDGTSVVFFTDYGFFLENGLTNISKVTVGGFADVTLGATLAGTSKVTSSLDCAQTSIQIEWQPLPSVGPFVSSINPNNGPFTGGQEVTLAGGRFGSNVLTTRVTFGGAPAAVVSVAENEIVVRTPSRALANPKVPEKVQVVVTIGFGTASPASTRPVDYTYNGTDVRMTISSVSPTSGFPDGNELVEVRGTNFGDVIATTRVTFGGVPASITLQNDAVMNVRTPRRILADPAVPETVDVGVTILLGTVGEQSAVLPRAFTYRADGGTCRATASLFISQVTPNSGSPDGGTVVRITGGGFGTNAERVRVEFGGRPAQVTVVAPNAIDVSTPQWTLQNPEVPENVPVKVYVDFGGPNQACVTQQSAFTYTRIDLVPTIYSASPRTGPNDSSTRVTLFGTGFQFPMQVFLTGGLCGGVRVEAPVVSISPTQIVFLTPIASGGGACLAGQLVDVEILNPATGKGARCSECFKYYSCPTVTGASPAFGPYNQTTTVTVFGQNFEEPVEASFAGTSGGTQRLVVSSVSSSAIVLALPPIDPRGGGGQQTETCENLEGSISINFLALSCGTVSVPYTYRVERPTVASASPVTLNQDGASVGSPLGSAPATITVTGTNFADPMTIELTLPDGSAVVDGATAYTIVNNPSVSNPATLTFPAPAIRNVNMNTQACVVGPGITGSRYVPTSFGIRVTNARTGCTAFLPNVLIYNPADTTCRSLPIITNTAGFPPPNASLCQPYGPYTFTAAGGVPPYTWSITGLPAGLALDPVTGVFSGTPVLPVAGVGGSTTPTVTVTVTDSALPTPQSAQRTFQMAIVDPNGPFSIVGQSQQSVPASGGSTQPFEARPNPTPGAFAPITWTIESVTPAPTVPFSQSPANGQTYSVFVPSANPPATYTVVIRATDFPSCGGASHDTTFTLTLTKNP